MPRPGQARGHSPTVPAHPLGRPGTCSPGNSVLCVTGPSMLQSWGLSLARNPSQKGNSKELWQEQSSPCFIVRPGPKGGGSVVPPHGQCIGLYFEGPELSSSLLSGWVSLSRVDGMASVVMVQCPSQVSGCCCGHLSMAWGLHVRGPLWSHSPGRLGDGAAAVAAAEARAMTAGAAWAAAAVVGNVITTSHGWQP